MKTGNLPAIWLTTCALQLLVANTALADPRDALCETLQNDQTVILIINGLGNHESEQYADWAHYLNEFYNSSHSEEFAYFNVSAASLSTMIEDGQQFATSYSMIFMKNGRPSLFHEGPILEPQAYEYVDLFYAQQAIPAHLHQFAPVETDIRLKGCQ